MPGGRLRVHAATVTKGGLAVYGFFNKPAACLAASVSG